MPCVLGFNVWSSFEPFGKGTCVLDLEDFVVSDVLIPIGSLAFAVFCTRRYGWGWKNFLAEVNAGEGWPFPARLRLYCAYGIPLIILSLFVTGLLRRFG
jgi:NSS family neurotransmitter:Na+ symporter